MKQNTEERDVEVREGGSPSDVIAHCAARARQFKTPCGNGEMIWHVWGEGVPLLLHHGAHGSWMHWIRNIPHLARTRTVIVPNLPGYGGSAPPEVVDDGDAYGAALAEGLRRIAGADVCLDVVGFSLGGVLAAHLAAVAPAAVRRLILVGTGGLNTPTGPMPTRSWRGLADPDQILAAHKQNLLAIMIRDPEKIDALALEIQSTNVPLAKVSPHPLVMPDRLLHVLPRITVPVDAIWGEFDGPHPDPELHRSVLSGFRPDLEFVVFPGAGHWVMYEAPDAFNRALDSLLALRPLSPAEAPGPCPPGALRTKDKAGSGT